LTTEAVGLLYTYHPF